MADTDQKIAASLRETTCVGVSFDHSGQNEAHLKADGAMLRTGKIQSAHKVVRFWLL
jgi:hypothetical protein